MAANMPSGRGGGLPPMSPSNQNLAGIRPAVAGSKTGSDKGGVIGDMLSAIPARFPRWWMWTGGAVVLIGLIVVGIVIAMNFAGNVNIPAGPAPVSPPTPVVPPVQLDLDWWTMIKSSPVVERSPFLVGHIDQLGVVAQVLGLALIGLLYADVAPRRKSQRGVGLVATMAVIAGLASVPLLNFAVGLGTGAVFLASLIVLVLWAFPIVGMFLHHDNTAIAIALALTSLMVYDIGRFLLPAGLGPIFGVTWPVWQGITGFGGTVILIMGFHWTQVALTVLLFGLMVGAMYFSADEVGKTYGRGGAVVAGLIMLLLWGGLSWLFYQGVVWLATTQHLTNVVLVVLEIIRPVIAWLLAMALAMGAGIAMGDLEVEFRQNRIKLGIGGGGGGWAQTTADFAVLATIFALAGVLIFVL